MPPPENVVDRAAEYSGIFTFGDNITEAGVPACYNKATIRNQGGTK